MEMMSERRTEGGLDMDVLRRDGEFTRQRTVTDGVVVKEGMEIVGVKAERAGERVRW